MPETKPNILHFATANIDRWGTVDMDSVSWRDGTFTSGKREVESSEVGKIAMYWWQDVKKFLEDEIEPFDDIVNATHEQFLSDPARYGIGYYLQPFEGGTYIWE